MEAARRPKDNSKAREKERKREEKELKRLAAATGVKLAATSAASIANATPIVAPTGDSKGSGWGSTFKAADSSSGGFKKSGWAAVASPASPSTNYSSPNPSGSERSGWALAEPSNTGFKKGGWASISPSPATDSPAPPRSPPPPPPTDIGTHLPSDERKLPIFTRGGFTNLDTTSEPIAAPDLPPMRSAHSWTENASHAQWKASSWAPATIASNASVPPLPLLEPAAPPPPAPPSTTPPPPPLDTPPSPPGDLLSEYSNPFQNADPGPHRHDATGDFGYSRRARVTYDSDRHSEPCAMDVDDSDPYGQGLSRIGGWQSQRPPYPSSGYDQEAGRPGYGGRARDHGYQSSRGHGRGRGGGYHGRDGQR
jgi:hypothetical protein